MHDNQPSNLIRLRDVIAPGGPLPIARSTWFEWVKTGRAPQPVKLGARVSAYRVSEIEAFIASPENWAREAASAPFLRNANDGGRK